MRISLIAAASAADVGVWPQPRHVEASGAPLCVSPSVGVVLIGAGVSEGGRRALRAAAHRAPRGLAGCQEGLETIRVEVQVEEEKLGLDTDYSYTVEVADGEAKVVAPTIYGAMYGLETFRQMGSTGTLPHSSITIKDSPDYAWRGLMLDAGRRFFPVSLVHNILDTMATVKMNVLHLHASDFCRFSIESKVFPNLTASLTGDYAGHYTQEDIKGLIAYAKARGIRVVPEFDVPGHSRCWRAVKEAGAQFCTDDESQNQLFGDPQNKTLEVVLAAMDEMASLFEDDVFHIGADETAAKGRCSTASTFALEREILNHLRSKGKTVEGWEEVLFDAGAATNDTIVNTWSRHLAKDATASGRRAVENKGSSFYFTRPAAAMAAGWKVCWYDLAAGVPAGQKSLVLGGEASMWTDTYLAENQCGAFGGGATPVGAALFPPARDAEFAQSVGGMIWPRGFVAAQSFWHYDAAKDPTSAEFVAAVTKITDDVIAKGGYACPTNCTCDQLTACGKPYIKAESVLV